MQMHGWLCAVGVVLVLCGCAQALDGTGWIDPNQQANTTPPGDGDPGVDPETEVPVPDSCVYPDGHVGPPPCDEPVGGDPYCDAPTVVFKELDSRGGCSGTSCHVPNLFPPDLVSEGVAARLIDVPAALCPNSSYVDSANIENSLILSKLTSTPTCGAQMPFNLPPLPADKVECIRSWIAGVAAEQ